MGLVCACSERYEDPTAGDYEGKLVRSISTCLPDFFQQPLDPKWFNIYEKEYFKDKIAVRLVR